MDSIFDMLDALEDLLDDARPMPFSNKIGINRDEAFEILSDIRLNLPGEIKQAQRIAADCDKIINDAHNKANAILKEAEDRCERMTSEHEITKMAKEQAGMIIDDAKATAREMRIGAVEYADEILANTEQAIKETLDKFAKQAHITEDFLTREIDIIYDNRQELRGTGR